jgi:anti-sigma factor RsiW
MTTAMTDECRRILTVVSSYLDGDLDAAACAEVEAHCRHCAACAEAIAGLRETVGLCRQAGSMPVPDAVLERARARVRRLLDAQAKTPAS